MLVCASSSIEPFRCQLSVNIRSFVAPRYLAAAHAGLELKESVMKRTFADPSYKPNLSQLYRVFRVGKGGGEERVRERVMIRLPMRSSLAACKVNCASSSDVGAVLHRYKMSSSEKS